MGNVEIVDVDTAALPSGLLDLVKGHLRIDSQFEDAYIKSTISRAIAWFETGTGISVNGATYKWTPQSIDFTDGVATIPETPVDREEWKVFNGPDVDTATDISGSYKLTTMATKGVGIFALEGAFVSNMAVTFDSGYFAVDDLPPGILNVLLLYVAHLYEHREILVPGSQAATPGWMNDILAPWWRPRV